MAIDIVAFGNGGVHVALNKGKRKLGFQIARNYFSDFPDATIRDNPESRDAYVIGNTIFPKYYPFSPRFTAFINDDMRADFVVITDDGVHVQYAPQIGIFK